MPLRKLSVSNLLKEQVCAINAIPSPLTYRDDISNVVTLDLIGISAESELQGTTSEAIGGSYIQKTTQIEI